MHTVVQLSYDVNRLRHTSFVLSLQSCVGKVYVCDCCSSLQIMPNIQPRSTDYDLNVNWGHVGQQG